MKKLIILPLSCSCFTALAGSDSTFTKENLRFYEPVVQNMHLDLKYVPYNFAYILTENEVVAIVDGGDPDSGLTGPVLQLFDKKKNHIRFQSEIYDNSEGCSLYEFRTDSHVLLLFENEYEYHTMLSLFVFDLKSRGIAFVGDFEVCENPLTYAEYTPYPVQDIKVVPSDSVINFRFTKSLYLHPGYENSEALDSLVYELNLNTCLLRTTQAWEGKKEE